MDVRPKTYHNPTSASLLMSRDQSENLRSSNGARSQKSMSKSNRSHSNPRDCCNIKQVKFDLSTNKHHTSFNAAKHGDMPLKLSGRSSSARQGRPMSGNK